MLYRYVNKIKSRQVLTYSLDTFTFRAGQEAATLARIDTKLSTKYFLDIVREFALVDRRRQSAFYANGAFASTVTSISQLETFCYLRSLTCMLRNITPLCLILMLGKNFYNFRFRFYCNVQFCNSQNCDVQNYFLVPTYLYLMVFS